MKYSFDTYDLYQLSPILSFTIRIRVRMKQEVDREVLHHAVNVATKRYPYFMVKLSIDENGAYVLSKNDAEIAVLKTSSKNPELCTKEIGEHLLYVDCEGNDIYFNISHALAGGRGALPWVMTCIYEYVVEKFNIIPNAPAIRKPDSPLLPGENQMPTEEQFANTKPIPSDRFKGGKSMHMDYVTAFQNPSLCSCDYFIFTFFQKEFVQLAKKNDNSLASLFSVLMFKAMDSILPADDSPIIGEIPHNPSESAGVPNSRYNLLTFIKVPYKHSMANWSLEKLGTITRGNIILQSDPQYSLNEIKRQFDYNNALDQIQGYTEKLKYAQENSLLIGKDAVHGTYTVSYTGNMDWGEVAQYVDCYVIIASGHPMLEITALDDKVFCCYHQILRTDKYVNAFKKVLDEVGITYKVEGPYPQNNIRHAIKDVSGK